jgi:hypothetical protein
MGVFQTAMFIGYMYSHLLVRTLEPECVMIVYFVFLALLASKLPLGIIKGSGTLPEHGVPS